MFGCGTVKEHCYGNNKNNCQTGVRIHLVDVYPFCQFFPAKYADILICKRDRVDIDLSM